VSAAPVPVVGIFKDPFDTPSAPHSLCDLRTQSNVLSRLLIEPELFETLAGDLAVSDFQGSVHQSLFRTLLRFFQEGKPFDVAEVAEAWDAKNQVGDPIVFLMGLLDQTIGNESSRRALRGAIERLHKLAHLRRLRSFGEVLQRLAENSQADPNELLQRIGVGVDALRDGYDLNGQLLPYAPRNLNRRPDLINLASVTAQQVPWLWKPYLAYGMLNMLSGDPGCGKTFIALALAASLSTGSIPYTGDPILPLNTVYLSTENSPEFSVKPRFDSLGGDAKRFTCLAGVVTGDGPKARRESVRLSDLPVLESAIKQTEARLLVVDPIQSFLGGEVDMHRSNETRPVLDGLAVLAQRHKVCILILRHFAKAAAGSAIYRGLGSIDLTGAVRSELHAGSRDNVRLIAHAKSNIGEFGKSIGYEIGGDGLFRWTGETSLTANDLTGSLMAEEDRDALTEAADILSDMLQPGAKLTTDVLAELRAAGVSEKTARRAKVKLGVKNRKRGGQDGRWEWALE
jgi:DNA repair protein RadA/Sms